MRRWRRTWWVPTARARAHTHTHTHTLARAQGLAFATLVQESPRQFNPPAIYQALLDTHLYQINGTKTPRFWNTSEEERKWKEEFARRVLTHWQAFLGEEAAKSDASYATIVQVVAALKKATEKKQG